MTVAALSRRAALLGAAAATVTPAAALMDAVAAQAQPVGPLTLAQASALDFPALWASLPAEVQARIGALAVRNEMYLQLAEDGGFHTTDRDREAAERLANSTLDEMRPAIWAAFPETMPTVTDEPYPLWIALGDREPPAQVDVRGLGMRPLVKAEWQWFVPEGSTLVELGGAVDLNGATDFAPRRWQFWTVAQIDAERARRHPEMADIRRVAA